VYDHDYENSVAIFATAVMTIFDNLTGSTVALSSLTVSKVVGLTWSTASLASFFKVVKATISSDEGVSGMSGSYNVQKLSLDNDKSSLLLFRNMENERRTAIDFKVK